MKSPQAKCTPFPQGLVPKTIPRPLRKYFQTLKSGRKYDTIRIQRLNSLEHLILWPWSQPPHPRPASEGGWACVAQAAFSGDAVGLPGELTAESAPLRMS